MSAQIISSYEHPDHFSPLISSRKPDDMPAFHAQLLKVLGGTA